MSFRIPCYIRILLDERLHVQVSTAVTKLKKDLCRGIPRVWSNYYMLDKDKVQSALPFFFFSSFLA